LSDRVYKCECGYTEDRDINAAMNLCTLGYRGINAHGDVGSDGQATGRETDIGDVGISDENQEVTDG
jgi:transposase